MKPAFFASLFFVVSTICVSAAEVDQPAGSFPAGAAISEITPPLGTPLIGGFTPRESTQIHDHLHVRCLVLDDGNTKLAFAIVDNVQIPREVYDAAKALIHEATGLAKEHILMAATHTHSAPSLRGKSYTVLNEPLDDYQRFVIRRVADGVRQAMNNLQPARIGWGTGKVPQHVFNRRRPLQNGRTVTSPFGDEDIAVMNPGRYASQLLKPAGPVNPKVYFVSIESTDCRPIALLANYWLHYVGGVEPGHVSADYFGVFSQRIAQLLSDSMGDHSAPPFVGILSNGASGDVNNNDYANYGQQRRYARYEKMREVAEDVAREVVRVRKTIKHHDWVKLGAAHAEVTLKYRRPTARQLDRAHEILDSSPLDSREAIFARRLIDAADWPETTSAIVQTFRVGDLGIAALPFEVFTETGLEIEKHSPFKDTFTMELANGGLGYLPTPRQHKLGGYETWLTVNRVEKGASPKLVDKLLELFQSLTGAKYSETGKPKEGTAMSWQEQAVDYARIMSRVKWTPVAEGMPRRGGRFEAGQQYTGVPYSSVKAEGRYIGFDIFLKTFLAAVENPKSVLYTENLKGKVKNAECYYGKVCSSYTSYALQCGIWYVSRLHGPEHRDGIIQVEPQTAQTARVGDVIFTPPATKGGGSHVEMVTEITHDKDDNVSHLRIEESRPQTTRNTNCSVKAFNEHLAARNRKLFRITDLDAWRGENRAESFLFPNYKEDSATPQINRALLLDRGDWVPYFKGQPVKFNVMDRDARGVRTLVIKRGDRVVEEISLSSRGVVERSFNECGDYTAYCVLNDDSLSAACEFAVCDLDFTAPEEPVSSGKSWELQLRSDNMKPIIAHLNSGHNSYGHHNVFITAEDRRNGRVVIPAGLIRDKGRIQIWLIGENRYGRLKKRRDVFVGE